MSDSYFLIIGSIILLFSFWFASALVRIIRSPVLLLQKWQTLTPADIKRCARLCELFFQEELQTPICRKNLSASFPELLNAFPGGICRLKSYLVCGAKNRDDLKSKRRFQKKDLYRRGEYFYGYSSLLLSSFIGESLRLQHGGKWISTPSGPQLQLQSSIPERKIIISPVKKFAELRNIASSTDKEQFKEYLLELCTLQLK